MTVAEMFDIKYRNFMKNVNRVTWQNIISQKCHPAETIYKGLEITVNDIRSNGGWNGELWQEIKAMHESKLLASNQHKQFYGQVTKYWLTEKGWRYINKDHSIC